MALVSRRFLALCRQVGTTLHDDSHLLKLRALRRFSSEAARTIHILHVSCASGDAPGPDEEDDEPSRTGLLLSLSSLRELRLEDPNHTPEDICAFFHALPVAMPRLRRLALAPGPCSGLEPGCLAALSRCPRLEELTLGAVTTDCGALDLRQLAHLHSLTVLPAHITPFVVSPDLVRHMTNHPSLTELNLGATCSDLSPLVSVRTLKTLALADFAAPSFTVLPGLSIAQLVLVRSRPETLASASRLPQLRTLQLHRGTISAEVASALSQLAGLETLKFVLPESASVDALAQMLVLANPSSESSSSSAVSDAADSLSPLAKTVQSITVPFEAAAGELQLLWRCPQLRYVDLNENLPREPNSLRDIARAQQLRQFTGKVNAADAPLLLSLPNLELLSLSDSFHAHSEVGRSVPPLSMPADSPMLVTCRCVIRALFFRCFMSRSGGTRVPRCRSGRTSRSAAAASLRAGADLPALAARLAGPLSVAGLCVHGRQRVLHRRRVAGVHPPAPALRPHARAPLPAVALRSAHAREPRFPSLPPPPRVQLVPTRPQPIGFQCSGAAARPRRYPLGRDRL